MKINNIRNHYSTEDKVKHEIKQKKKAEKLAKDFEVMFTKELMKEMYSSLKQNNIIYDSLIIDEHIKIIAPKTGIYAKALPFILKNQKNDK